MSANQISDDARRFLDEHITSVAQLEMVLLLRNNPQQQWTAERLSRELRVEPAWALAQLRDFSRRGLLQSSDQGALSFQYDPQSPELDQSVIAVSQAYLLQRVSVIELIYGKPSPNIRAFADAFRLRKEPPSG